MTKQHKAGARALRTVARNMGVSRHPNGFGLLAFLTLALTGPVAHASQPATFVLQASGFESGVVANDRGRLVQEAPGRPQQLAPGRWVAVDHDGSQGVWFDADGRVSLKGPYVEVRSPPFERNVDDPDQSPLFVVWSQAGVGLLRADGSTFIEWQPGEGKWSRTAHPQRYSWRSSEGERIFDPHGKLRLALTANELRVAGPFPDRTAYLVCDPATTDPCALRDEAGGVLWRAPVGDLQPLATGGWLGRQGSAWRQLDAHGQPTGDRTRVYVEGLFYGLKLSAADDEVPAWPRWMVEYRVDREDAEGVFIDPNSAVGGLMHSDGRFFPVPDATAGQEVCPGVWRYTMPDQAQRGDDQGKLAGPFPAFSWNAVEAHPDLRLAVQENGQQTLVDCSGRQVIDTPALDRITFEPGGMIGTLAGEPQPRLWLDADLQPHLLPDGSVIEATSRDGALLLVSTGGGLRLYNLARGRFVGAVMQSAELLPTGAKFLQDGYYGFMDADGNERLPPRYNDVSSWGKDRLWAWRYVEEGGSTQTQESLHRVDGSVIKRWNGVTVSDSPMLRDLPDQGPVTHLVGPTFDTAQGRYFGQQWVNRGGRTLFLAMHCQRESREDEGGVIEALGGEVRQHGKPCEIPDDVRAAMGVTQ